MINVLITKFINSYFSRFLIALVLTALFPALLRAAAPPVPFKTILDNGLTVILEENPSAPAVAIQMWVKVGGADEEEDEAGLAHVFEHMLFKGTEKRGVGQIAKEVEASGGDINAFTSYDHTVYHIVLASRYMERGIDIIADAIQNSSFDPDELKRELLVVVEEFKRGEDNPTTRLYKRLMAEAFTTHTYRRPVIGFRKVIESLDRKTLLKFFKKWYVPNNMALVISGDFRREEVLPVIQEKFRDFQPSEDPRAKGRRQEPSQKGFKKFIITDETKEAHLELAYHIPGLNDPDVYALDVLSTILGNGRTSRLYRRLKGDENIVHSTSSYAMTPKDPGLFFVFAALDAGETERTLKIMLEELRLIRKEGVTDEELERAKMNLESDFVFQRETVQGRARQLGSFETTAGDLSFEEKYIEGIVRVTSEDIKRVANKYLTKDNLTAGLLLPNEKAGIFKEGDLEKIAIEAAGSEEPADKIRKFTLKNGLTLIVKENPSSPIVSIYGAFLGALLAENEKNNGITNFIARMLTRGTSERNAEAIANEVESMAGSISGFSGRNSFGLSGTFLRRFFPKGLEIYADLIQESTFDATELKKVRKDILSDIEAQEDNLTTVAMNLFNETIYKKHPYRMNRLGTKKTVTTLKRKHLLSFYKEHATPENMVLAIVGDVEAGNVVEMVEGLFGRIDKGKRLKLDQPAEKRAEKSSKTEIFREKEQAHLLLGFQGPGLGSPDSYAMDVLSNVLATQGGRLFVELRDKQGLAYVVTAFAREGINTGVFAVYMGTDPSNLDRAINGIKVELNKVVTEDIAEEELEMSKTSIIGNYEIGLQRNSSQASDMALNEILGLGYDEFKRYPGKISAVTLEDIRRVAKKYIDLDAYTLSIVRPERPVR